MDLQELTAVWKSYDKELDSKAQLNKEILKELSLHKIKDYLFEIKWENIFEISVTLFFLYFLLQFLPDQLSIFKFAVPVLILIAFSILSIIFCAYKLYLFYKIDSKSSVLQTQKNVEKLNYLEQLEINSLYVVIPVLSTVFMIFIAKAFFDFNLYSLGNWLISYTIGSIIIAVIIIFFLKKFPDKKLQKSMEFLREIKEMES